MDSKMLARVCEEMRGRRTDQLLGIWVQNDRDIWSAEAFEAVRMVLVERNVRLPPQNRPARNVPRAQVAVDAFWMRWLRMLLIGALVVAAADLMSGIAYFVLDFSTRISLPRPGGEMPLELVDWFLGTHGINLGGSLLLVLGTFWCWKRRNAGRQAMIIYAWITLGLTALNTIMAAYRVAFARGSFRWEADTIQRAVHMAVFPLVILIFMTREPIKEHFGATKRGFDPTLSPRPMPSASSETAAGPEA
ncbi:MAG: hypothetical protein NTU53_14720 [Planctomycetota bacterium]|nr:hypothetical protein [Planctomycetota bacterium]